MKAGRRRPREWWEPAWEGVKLGRPGFSCTPKAGVQAAGDSISSPMASGLSLSFLEGSSKNRLLFTTFAGL